jgi:hypothetical protein
MGEWLKIRPCGDRYGLRPGIEREAFIAEDRWAVPQTMLRSGQSGHRKIGLLSCEVWLLRHFGFLTHELKRIGCGLRLLSM